MRSSKSKAMDQVKQWCGSMKEEDNERMYDTHTHTHTFIYIYNVTHTRRSSQKVKFPHYVIFSILNF